MFMHRELDISVIATNLQIHLKAGITRSKLIAFVYNSLQEMSVIGPIIYCGRFIYCLTLFDHVELFSLRK